MRTMGDGREGVFGGRVLELAGLDFFELAGVAGLLLLAVVLVECGVLSLLVIHSSNAIIGDYMLDRKPPHRHFITLNSRARRHSSLTALRPPPCTLALLSPNELTVLLSFLPLVDLSRLHEALRASRRTRDAAKAVIVFVAKSQRFFSAGELREFLGYTILRRRKLSKWRVGERRREAEWERISLDVERTNVWFCRSREQVEGMRGYLRRVLVRLSCEVARFSYVQGFHCVVRAMFESRLSEQEAFLLGSYFLREMQLARYYENHLQRMRELCYVLDVYVYNYLPAVHFHLKRHELSAQCYAISWFLTLFAQQLPLPVLNRLWSLFLLKGWKALVKFSLALLCAFQQEILARGQGDLPGFVRDLQGQLNPRREVVVWQLFCSMKVTNRMVGYLSRHMLQLESDREISIMQLKAIRDNPLCTYEQAQSFEAYSFPSYFSLGVCCEKVEASSTFPYCNDF